MKKNFLQLIVTGNTRRNLLLVFSLDDDKEGKGNHRNRTNTQSDRLDIDVNLAENIF